MPYEMDPVRNLDYVFKLLFREFSEQEFIGQIISLTESGLKSTEIRTSDCGDHAVSNELEKTLTSIELMLKIFNTRYEPRFNVFIEYIFDQILNILQLGITSDTLSTLPLSSIINAISLVFDITISHSCKKSMIKFAEFYTCIIEPMKCISEESSISLSTEELTLRLTILSDFYETINKAKKSKNHAAIVKELAANMRSENCECNLFSKLVFSEIKAVAAQTLINIVPKYIQYSESNVILQIIWNEISQSLLHKNTEYSRVFIVLCYLSDLYFSTDNKLIIADIYKSNNYCILIQNGLKHSDCAVRKQALFLLKASLNYVTNNEINFGLGREDKDLKHSLENSGKDKLLLNWESTKNFNGFKEFCTIMEYLEEKQVHLLKPIFDMIERFVEIYAETIDVTWILIIVQRMVSHDNVMVVKHGIFNLLRVPIEVYSVETMRVATRLLVSSLNCTQLYLTDWLTLIDELQRYFEVCSTEEEGKDFFKLIIAEISKLRWSSEALFFMMYSFQLIITKQFWEKEELDLMRKVLDGAVNHYTYIQSGMQCLLLHNGINLIDPCVNLDDVARLLSRFERKTSLRRGTKLWKNLVVWVTSSYAVTDVEKFIKKAVNDVTKTVNVGKMILVIYDAYSEHEKLAPKIVNMLTNISSSFADVRTRPYCDMEDEEFYLSVICEFMTECTGDPEMLKIFSPSLTDILSYIEIKLESIYSIRDFEAGQNVFEQLDTVLKFGKNDFAILECINNWFEKTVNNLSVESVPLRKFVHVKSLCLIIINNVCFVSHPKMRLVSSYLKSELSSTLEKSPEDLTLTKDLQTLWGKLNTEYIKRKWQLLSYISDPAMEALIISNSEFLKLCFEALDIGGWDILQPLMNALDKALPLLLTESSLRQLMDSILNAIMERKKNDDFFKLIKCFVEITFQSDIMQTEDNIIRGMLLDYSQQLFSESNVGIANIFMRHMRTVEFDVQAAYFFLDLLPRALLYGQIQRKDERLITDICSIIEVEKLSPLSNNNGRDNEVRTRAILIVVSLSPRNKEHCHFAENLVDALITLEENINRNKTRYFADSYVHRVKERLMQSLLLLESYMSKEKSEQIWEWLANKIILENNQPSVRYMQEWLMLRLLYHKPHLRDSLWKYFDENLEIGTSSLCSLIAIVYHSGKCIAVRDLEPWIDKSIQTIVSYCMAQNFSVRLYAQVTLQKLLTLAQRLDFIPIVEKYRFFSSSLSHSVKKGNAVKNSSKIQKDFYFSAFDPVDHYSLDTIFFHLPRLADVNSDEWISVLVFKQYGVEDINSSIILKSKNPSLEYCSGAKWNMDGTRQDNYDDLDLIRNMELVDFQKKMIPVKSLVPDWEELLQDMSIPKNSDTENDKEGLVVVASLIDRLPNLGGLSRTCEVFGASELVIGSLKYIEDHQFQSLSVTAEKWISITEVKPYYLSEYLVKMKENGYTILGAEQTGNSQPLESSKFPKKSVLLLGNEKEGIPPALLPLMDMCIEIPQKGMIRSLNVHVTGALFIWEYAKQHLFLNEKSVL